MVDFICGARSSQLILTVEDSTVLFSSDAILFEFGLYLVWRAVGDGRVPSVVVNRWLIVASVANTVYISAYYPALARTPIAVVASVLGTSTLLVVAGAAIFLQADERVTWKLGGATAVVVAAILLVVQA